MYIFLGDLTWNDPVEKLL